MDDDLYDEFGNYIGPEFEDSDEDDVEEDRFGENGYDDREYDAADGQLVSAGDAMEVADENRIVLHEDKKYYPDTEEVYPGVRTVTLDEDAQGIEEPIIKPIRTKNFSVLEKEQPNLVYSTEFMTALMNTPSLIRNIAVLGNFHHGKTLFLDTLIQATHVSVHPTYLRAIYYVNRNLYIYINNLQPMKPFLSQEKPWDPTKNIRYTDSRKDEQERELSIKSTAVTLVMEDLSGKSYLLNALDCPGHVNFNDESTAALRAADGAVVVVDAVEGVMMNTRRLIKQALLAAVPITLVSVV